MTTRDLYDTTSPHRPERVDSAEAIARVRHAHARGYRCEIREEDPVTHSRSVIYADAIPGEPIYLPAGAERQMEAEQERREWAVEQCRGHRAIAAQSRTVAWTHCVSGGSCSGAAHGGVTHVDRCRCGAERRTESNGCHSATSGWYAPSL